MIIKNIIFDIGNVLVRWAPFEAIKSVFPGSDPSDFYEKMRPIWIDLNLGQLSEKEAIIHYQKIFNIPKTHFVQLMHELKIHQKPLPGSIELLAKLQSYQFNIFAISDNVREIMAYHRINSLFPKYFKDIIVSADVGLFH